LCILFYIVLGLKSKCVHKNRASCCLCYFIFLKDSIQIVFWFCRIEMAYDNYFFMFYIVKFSSLFSRICSVTRLSITRCGLDLRIEFEKRSKVRFTNLFFPFKNRQVSKLRSVEKHILRCKIRFLLNPKLQDSNLKLLFKNFNLSTSFLFHNSCDFLEVCYLFNFSIIL
jgi:hypothetical protein